MTSWDKHKPWIIHESEGRYVDLFTLALVLVTFAYLAWQVGRGIWW